MRGSEIYPESGLPNCETCLERGRTQKGIHPVGAGYLCDPCFRGKGSPEENTGELREPKHSAHRREQWRRYRAKDAEKWRAYQREYKRQRRNAATV